MFVLLSCARNHSRYWEYNIENKNEKKKQKENQTKPSLQSHGVTVKWGIQSTNELCNMLDEWSED